MDDNSSTKKGFKKATGLFRSMVLEASNLSYKRNHQFLFSDVSLCIKNGHYCQVTGVNGSGKTTLLKLLAGLNQSYRGCLSWNKQPLTEAFQSYCQHRWYLGHLLAMKLNTTPVEHLLWLCPQPLKKKVVFRALAEVGLQGYETVHCQQLSEGQKRRVNIASLLLVSATLWILDEPFTSLDQSMVYWLEKYIDQHVRQGGSVVLTSHQPVRSQHALQCVHLGGSW